MTFTNLLFRTKDMINTLEDTTKKELLQIYKFDFLLFNYSWKKYNI